MPDRGLLAPLSPNEEVTLRRVALGIARPADLPGKDVKRLKALALVEEHGPLLESSAISPCRTAPPSTQAHRTKDWQRWPSSSARHADDCFLTWDAWGMSADALRSFAVSRAPIDTPPCQRLPLRTGLPQPEVQQRWRLIAKWASE
jgi:hypothetical protein